MENALFQNVAVVLNIIHSIFFPNQEIWFMCQIQISRNRQRVAWFFLFWSGGDYRLILFLWFIESFKNRIRFFKRYRIGMNKPNVCVSNICFIEASWGIVSKCYLFRDKYFYQLENELVVSPDHLIRYGYSLNIHANTSIHRQTSNLLVVDSPGR